MVSISPAKVETYSAGISQKVRANRLNVAIGRRAELADGLEVLLAGPASRQHGQRQRNLHVGSHGVVLWWGVQTMLADADNFWRRRHPARLALPKHSSGVIPVRGRN